MAVGSGREFIDRFPSRSSSARAPPPKLSPGTPVPPRTLHLPSLKNTQCACGPSESRLSPNLAAQVSARLTAGTVHGTPVILQHVFRIPLFRTCSDSALEGQTPHQAAHPAHLCGPLSCVSEALSTFSPQRSILFDRCSLREEKQSGALPFATGRRKPVEFRQMCMRPRIPHRSVLSLSQEWRQKRA